MDNKIKVIAVDFDGTIVENAWPDIGPLIPRAKEVLDKFWDNGGVIIINTCREGEYLDKACRFLVKNNVPFDYVNENDPERIQDYGNDCRKIGADVYIDDKDYYSLRTGSVNWDMIDTLINGD